MAQKDEPGDFFVTVKRTQYATEAVAIAAKPEGELTYSDLRKSDEPEDFLVTVYGGDTDSSDQVVAQTRITGYVRQVVEQDDDSDASIHIGAVVIGPQDLAVHLVAEAEILWINRLAVTTPKKLQWVRKEVDLPMPPTIDVGGQDGEHGLYKVGEEGDECWEYGKIKDDSLHIKLVKGQTVTINFPERLLEIK